MGPPIRTILLDALGTLVELEPPWPLLRGALEAPPPDEVGVPAVRAEMRYYREHSHEGRDAVSLADLRRRCAGVLSRELGRPVDTETLMAAIRFHPFADASPALARLRARGLRLVCVSNWDCSLPDVLATCGLAGLLDGAVHSAGAGAAKPDPLIFTRALSIAGSRPSEALHVGDSRNADVEGARAAGIHALLLDRQGGGDIASLSEIEEHLER